MKESHQPLYSARQRMVVLTFDTPELAQAWDDANHPLHETLAIEHHTK